MKFISVILATMVVAGGTSASAGAKFKPVKLHEGMQTPGIAKLQMMLRMNTRGNFFRYNGGYTGYFGAVTKDSLQKWQRRVGHQPTGWIVIGSSQWNQLRSEVMTFRVPNYIDPQVVGAARQDGWAIDASKSPGMVSVLHYDAAKRKMTVPLSIAASYGGFKADDGKLHVTTNGVFHICMKGGIDFKSTSTGPWRGAPMPWAAFFNCSEGDAFHYDGLNASHGCVHIPSMTAAKFIHDLAYGTTVVVHE